MGLNTNTLRYLTSFCLVAAVSMFSSAAWGADAYAASISITLPGDPGTFSPGPGGQIAASHCLICHSSDYVYTQPPHSQEVWTKIVHKMKSAFGCPIPEDQIPKLVTYLVSQNPKQTAMIRKEASTEKIVKEKGNEIERGKNLYQTNCLTCHGASGKGNGPLGPALIPPASDLTVTKQKTDEELMATIQNGRAGTAMSPWNNILSQQELQNVLAYVRSLSQ